MDVLNTIQKLREELNLHNYNYYVLDNATISDYEFDIKLKEITPFIISNYDSIIEFICLNNCPSLKKAPC